MITTINNKHNKLNVPNSTDKGNAIRNLPNLRFPEFREEWEEHELSEYLDFKNGLNPKPNQFGKGIKFISVMDILNNAVITYDCIRASVSVSEEDMSAFSVQKGDILFQRSSETLEDVGRANVYVDDIPAVFGGFVIRGKQKTNYNPLFFKYLLSSPLARKRIIRMGAGAQHFNIGQEGLSKVKLPFACIDEQNKIAKILYLLDKRISLQNKIIEDLKKLKSAIIEIEYTPNTKNTSPIGDVIEQISKRNKNNAIQNVLSVSNRQGFIKQSDQFENRNVASEDTSNYKIAEQNDFAFNPARINVGSIARLTTFEKGIVSPMYVCFRTQENVAPEYIDYFFESKHFYCEIQKRLEGSVRQCLSFEGLCNIPLSLPSFEIQQRIGKRIFTLGQKIKMETDLLELLNKQKQYLLRQMFI